MAKVLHGENQQPPFFIFPPWYEGDVILNLWQKVNFQAQIASPYQSTPFWKPWFVYLCTPGIKVLVNECMAESFLIRIYIYIYIYLVK